MKQFLVYFNEQWVDMNPGWYVGVAPGVPCTNNALESTNNVIKREFTLRERLPLSDFLDLLLQIVKVWSEERDPKGNCNAKEFITKRKPTLAEWTRGYQWARMKKTIIIEGESYYASAGD